MAALGNAQRHLAELGNAAKAAWLSTSPQPLIVFRNSPK